AKTRRAESSPNLTLINQPAAAANGFLGEGVGVAVIDTGLILGNLGCTAVNTPAGTCRVVAAQNFAANWPNQDNTHGTNVAGIVLGVAPRANIVALDVFAGDLAADPDILAAINWVLANQARYAIRVANLSLGDASQFPQQCGNSVFEPAFAALRAAGIIPVVAAGNTPYGRSGFRVGLAEPGCAPSAFAVGAVYAATYPPQNFGICSDSAPAPDRIACFSQSASYLGLLAPGAIITAAGITEAGTSQAAPHVAGAIAVLAAIRPSATPEQIIVALQGAGPLITDPRNGVATRRLDVLGAAQLIQALGLGYVRSNVTNVLIVVTPPPATVSLTARDR
ncbi:MAG: S8 family serine peptidase, partial [Dehalococcoidia bacterium]|nr:S8 family serine peptidase [Dehalococcoidia bacterium]